jgi:hypothetical protein
MLQNWRNQLPLQCPIGLLQPSKTQYGLFRQTEFSSQALHLPRLLLRRSLGLIWALWKGMLQSITNVREMSCVPFICSSSQT